LKTPSPGCLVEDDGTEALRSAFATFWRRCMCHAVSGDVAGTNPTKSEAEQPLAELGVGVAGTTIPPGWSFALVEPATFAGLKSVRPQDCGVGDSSRNTGPDEARVWNLICNVTS